MKYTNEDKSCVQIGNTTIPKGNSLWYTLEIDKAEKAGTIEPWKTEEEILEEVRTEKLEEINSVCSKHITAGFISSALGTQHFYQSTEQDQTNLKTAAQSYKDRTFKCRDLTTGETIFAIHTQAQIQAVHEAFCDLLEACLLHAFNKKAEIKSAKSAEDLKLIKW